LISCTVRSDQLSLHLSPLGAEKVNLVGILEETFKNMTGRIDKKIKFSKLAEIHPDVVVVPGPTVFRCDPLPAGCDGVGPKVTAPNCPPGIYMQNWTAYADGKALKIPTGKYWHQIKVLNILLIQYISWHYLLVDVSESLKLKDGSSIGCLALEHVALSSNGSLIPCKIVDKTCVDGNGTQIKEPYTLQIVPVFVDLNMVPYHRDMLIETYPDKPQWGKFDCTSDPDHPASKTFPIPNSESPIGHNLLFAGPPTGPVPAKDPDRKPEESDGTKPTGPTEPATGPTLPPPELNCTVGPNDKGIGYIDCRPPGLNDANTAEFTLAFPVHAADLKSCKLKWTLERNYFMAKFRDTWNLSWFLTQMESVLEPAGSTGTPRRLAPIRQRTVNCIVNLIVRIRNPIVWNIRNALTKPNG